MLCAGLFPNVVSVQLESCKARTREDGKVEAHPGLPVRASDGSQATGWSIEGQVHSICIRDSSIVSDIALLLFGGKVDVDLGGAEGGGISMLSGWANFATGADVAQLVVGLRRLDTVPGKTTTRIVI